MPVVSAESGLIMNFQDDFTPVSHSLAKELGLVCAAVYGAVWRYCQMEEGECRASLNKLGSDINLDRATVMRSIEKLCELGYLVDLTPDRRNAPHTYILCKTVALCNSLDITVDIRNTLDGETVAYNNSSKRSVAENNKSVEQGNSSPQTVAESYLNKKNKEIIEEEEFNNDLPLPKVRQPRFGEVTQTYQYEIGGLSQTVSDCLDDDIKTYGADWVIEAMKRAAKANVRRLDYVEGILKNWQVIGGPQNDKPIGEREKKKGSNGQAQKNGLPTLVNPELPPVIELSPCAQVWQQAQDRLKAYSATLSGVEARESTNGTFTLAAPEKAKEWINGRLHTPILRALQQVRPEIRNLQVVVK